MPAIKDVDISRSDKRDRKCNTKDRHQCARRMGYRDIARTSIPRPRKLIDNAYHAAKTFVIKRLSPVFTIYDYLKIKDYQQIHE